MSLKVVKKRHRYQPEHADWGELDAPVGQKADGDELPQSVDYNELDGLYRIAEPTGVRTYLRNRPSLRQTLRMAYTEISKRFKPLDVVITVSRGMQPGAAEIQGLYVRIFTELEVDEALNRLDDFDSWWLEQPFAVRDHLCFDVDFR